MTDARTHWRGELTCKRFPADTGEWPRRTDPYTALDDAIERAHLLRSEFGDCSDAEIFGVEINEDGSETGEYVVADEPRDE